jgi:hypothetical protein
VSHVATVDVHITDLAALKAACTALGLVFHEGQTTHRWYGRSVGDAPLPDGLTIADLGKCEHAIGLLDNTHAYEVGVVRRRDGKPGYQLMYDSWRGGFGLEDVIGSQAGKLRQHYAAEVAARQARKQGYRVTQGVRADGTLRLVCTRR